MLMDCLSKAYPFLLLKRPLLINMRFIRTAMFLYDPMPLPTIHWSRHEHWIPVGSVIVLPWDNFGFPSGASDRKPTCQCKRHKRCSFNPWVGKIPWRRAWQPTPVFLPGASHGQSSLVGYSPEGHKDSGHDWATNTFTFMHNTQTDKLAIETMVSASITKKKFFLICLLDVFESLLSLWQYCFCLKLYFFFFFLMHGTWDLSSPTRDWTPALEGKVLATGPPWTSPTKTQKGIHSDYSCACVLTHSCVRLANRDDCSPSGSSVHGILQARLLEWVATPFSRAPSRPRDRTRVSCIGRRALDR